MKTLKKHLVVAVAALTIFVNLNHVAFGGDCSSKTAKKDIVNTAVAAGNFETLIAAAKAAGLVDVLSSEGPLTVFAPTDEAFGKLGKKAINDLLAKPELLASILKYHVVPGRVMAADVVKLSTAKTALGQSVKVDTTHGVKINNANVIKADIETSNGVIHVVDSVLLPSNDIIQTALTAGSFNTLLAALEAAGLTSVLRGDGPFTVFAPTDEAFAKLPKGTVDALLNDIPKLKAILTYHVVSGKVTAGDVVKLSEATTLQGQKVSVDASSGVKINNARVVSADVMADNGVIHVIDTVLLPKSEKRTHADMPASELIQEAIQRGVPLFNRGQHHACAAVYEVAAMGLLAGTESLRDVDRSNLMFALATSKDMHNAGQRAWHMRVALDDVYSSVMENIK